MANSTPSTPATNDSTSGIKRVIMSPASIAIAKTTVALLAAWGSQDLFRRGYKSYRTAQAQKALGAPQQTAPAPQPSHQARA